CRVSSATSILDDSTGPRHPMTLSNQSGSKELPKSQNWRPWNRSFVNGRRITAIIHADARGGGIPPIAGHASNHTSIAKFVRRRLAASLVIDDDIWRLIEAIGPVHADIQCGHPRSEIERVTSRYLLNGGGRDVCPHLDRRRSQFT